MKTNIQIQQESGAARMSRSLRLLALTILISFAGSQTAPACVLCAGLNKAKANFEKAQEQENKAADAAAAGDARAAGYANCRALTMRANACYKIRSSVSKFGAALVKAKLARIWPNAPSEAECDALISAFQGKPSAGGAGGLGGSGGGAGGNPGGPPGAGASGSARSGAAGVSGTPGTTVNPVIFIAGNDSDDLPANFRVVITPSVVDSEITLGSAATFTETSIGNGEVRLTGVAPSTNTIAVNISASALPGHSATWTYTVENLTTGEFLADTGFSFTVSVVSPPSASPAAPAPAQAQALLSEGDQIIIKPKGSFVKKTLDNSSPVTLEWEIQNTGDNDVSFWLAVGPATDTLSRDTYFNSLVPHDILDYFTSPATVGPASQPTLTNPPATPMSLLVPVTAPGGGGGGAGAAQTVSVPMVPGNFCEDGMTVCCALRAFFQSGTDLSGDPIYELIAEQIAPQYIFNQTAVETNNVDSKILIVGEVQFTEFPLIVNINGAPIFVDLHPGEKGTDVGEAIALAVNGHPGRFDGFLPVNGMSGPNMAMISGFPHGSVSLNSTGVFGLGFALEETVASMSVGNVNAVPVTNKNGFWNVTADVNVGTTLTSPVSSDIMARLEVNGAPFGEPILIGANGQAAGTMQTYPIMFENVVLGGFENHIAVRLDPGEAVTEDAGDVLDNVDIQIVELSLMSVQPIQLANGFFNVEGPPNFGVAVFFSETLLPDSFMWVAQGTTDGGGMASIPLPGSTQGLDKAFFRGTGIRPQAPDEIIPAGGQAPSIVHTILTPELIRQRIMDNSMFDAELLGVTVVDAATGLPAPGVILIPELTIRTSGKRTLKPDPADQSLGNAYEGALEISYFLQADPTAGGKTFYVDVEFGVLLGGNPTGFTETTPLVVFVRPQLNPN